MQALNAVAANVSFVEIESDKGHDAFLLDEPELFAHRARLPQRRRAQARPRGAPRSAALMRGRDQHGRPARRASITSLIAEMVTPGSRVLDVGCGDGALLQLSG